MWNVQDTFETHRRSFISDFSICMTVPLLTVPLSNLLGESTMKLGTGLFSGCNFAAVTSFSFSSKIFHFVFQ